MLDFESSIGGYGVLVGDLTPRHASERSEGHL